MKLTSYRNDTRQGGFSLAELTVAVGLLAVVVLALYSMFNQVQKAFHQSLNQVDTTEGVRSAIDLIAADLQKAGTPGINQGICMVIHPGPKIPAYGSTNRLFLPGQSPNGPIVFPLNEILYMYRDAQGGWHTAGYLIGNSDNLATAPTNGAVGLYRYDDATISTNELNATRSKYYESPLTLRGNHVSKATRMRERFVNLLTGRTGNGPYANLANVTPRVLDGVVYFRVTALDREGRPYLLIPRTGTDIQWVYPPLLTNNAYLDDVSTNKQIYLSRDWPNNSVISPNESAVVFYGTNLPTAIEIELGILDTQQVERFRTLSENSPKAAQNFLANSGAQLVTLKQRVNLRTAPFSYQ
ncbi:MAG TPA: prepilin-type N-terminal cleavage/methylation domain-containing protein [Candidatus Limnocylindria bacterium]|jgi:type II secretory pathway pseudopilin PulG|nr:prepilin-type N-terminal cleavage/methylation domain-containing protein [Candidatus Limnocylindria bacterium]